MKTRPWRHIYHNIRIPRPKNHDIEIPRPKNCDIEIRGLKHHEIKKRRKISHYIVIPRRFSRAQKATTRKPLHRDFKTKSRDIRFLRNSYHYAPWYLLNLERKNYDSNKPNQISYKHDLSNNIFDLQSHHKTTAAFCSYYLLLDLSIRKTYTHFLRKHLHPIVFCFLKSKQFRKIHRKPPVTEPHFY